MNHEIVARNANVPAVSAPPIQEQVLKNDVTIAKVLLMQGSSEFVKKDRCRMPGDLARNSNKEKLGDDKLPMEFIPLTFTNLWMLSEDEKGRGEKNDFKFRGYEPRTSENQDMEWEFMQDGVKWKRTKVVQVFALLVDDLKRLDAAMEAFEKTGEMPDLDAVVLPVVIPFKNTSFKGAKDVLNIFTKAQELSATFGKEVPAYSQTMKLEVHSETSKDGDDYFTLRCSPGNKTAENHRAVCKRWRDRLLSGAAGVKIDESGDGAGSATSLEDIPF